MAGEYIFAQNEAEALRKIKAMYPRANKYFVQETPQRNKYYAIADIVDFSGVVKWHN